MACLSCHSMTRALVFASLPINNTTNSPSAPQPINTDSNPSIPITKTSTKTRTRTATRHGNKREITKQQVKQQLKLANLEQAIGAGSYRDIEPKDSQQKKSVFDGLLPNSGGVVESPVEMKLREMGEWCVDKTEKELRSSVDSAAIYFHVARGFWSHKAPIQLTNARRSTYVEAPIDQGLQWNGPNYRFVRVN